MKNKDCNFSCSAKDSASDLFSSLVRKDEARCLTISEMASHVVDRATVYIPGTSHHEYTLKLIRLHTAMTSA